MLRPASQHRSCARLGDREGFGWPAQAVRHDAVALGTVGHGRGPHQHERRGVRVQAGQQNHRATGAGAAIRPAIGRRLRRRSVVMAGSDVGAVHGMMRHRPPDDRSLMIRWRVTVRVMVTAARRREVMPGAERAVRHEGKRRHDRQSGREASAQQLGVTNHVRTDSSRIGMILVVRISPVQIESGNTRQKCAYLVAFGKDPGSETQNASGSLGYRQGRLPIEHPEIWPKSSSCRISRM